MSSKMKAFLAKQKAKKAAPQTVVEPEQPEVPEETVEPEPASKELDEWGVEESAFDRQGQAGGILTVNVSQEAKVERAAPKTWNTKTEVAAPAPAATVEPPKAETYVPRQMRQPVTSGREAFPTLGAAIKPKPTKVVRKKKAPARPHTGFGEASEPDDETEEESVEGDVEVTPAPVEVAESTPVSLLTIDDIIGVLGTMPEKCKCSKDLNLATDKYFTRRKLAAEM